MLRSFLRDRRAVGRPTSARFHGDEAAGGRVRTQPSAVLADPPRRHGESQRCANALAHRERTFSAQPIRRALTGSACMGCRAIPCAWIAARPLEHRA